MGASKKARELAQGARLTLYGVRPGGERRRALRVLGYRWQSYSHIQGNRFDRPLEYPRTFRRCFQTKHSTAAFGTGLIVEEMRRIRSERCEDGVVENAKAGFISGVVNSFGSPYHIVSTFADDDYTGRPDDYWRHYAARMVAVTADDVLAVAQTYLHPDTLIFLVVGAPEAVMAGSDTHANRFSDFGQITIPPLRDPLTLELP